MASIPAVPSAAPPLIGGRPMTSIRARLAFPIVCLASFVWSGPAWPAWPHDPLTSVRLATAAGDQLDPVAVPDGSGGVYVALDLNGGLNHDIYLQHVTSSGGIAPGWPAAGLPVCTAAFNQFGPVAVADGGGGVFLAWDDG